MVIVVVGGAKVRSILYLQNWLSDHAHDSDSLDQDYRSNNYNSDFHVKIELNLKQDSNRDEFTEPISNSLKCGRLTSTLGLNIVDQERVAVQKLRRSLHTRPEHCEHSDRACVG